MTDIVKRLRDACAGGDGCKCTLNEAADYIEKLDDEWREMARHATKCQNDAAKYVIELNDVLRDLSEERAHADRLAEALRGSTRYDDIVLTTIHHQRRNK